MTFRSLMTYNREPWNNFFQAERKILITQAETGHRKIDPQAVGILNFK